MVPAFLCEQVRERERLELNWGVYMASVTTTVNEKLVTGSCVLAVYGDRKRRTTRVNSVHGKGEFGRRGFLLSAAFASSPAVASELNDSKSALIQSKCFVISNFMIIHLLVNIVSIICTIF